MKAITIKEVLNAAGKFSKASFLKRLSSGEIKIFEKDNKSDIIEWNEVDAYSIIKLKEGISFNAKYYQPTEILEAYLGTSFQYKFTF